MKLKLSELVGGALDEKAQIELDRVAANIADPNTKATAARSVTITLTFKPDETRSIVASNIEVKSKLAASNGIPARFIVDQDKEGKAVIAELVSNQPGQLAINQTGNITDDKGREIDTSTGEVKQDNVVPLTQAQTMYR